MKAFFFVMAFLIVGCTSATKSESPSQGKIQIFFNNDNFAYLETCGCRISPIGGMDRRWNAFIAYPENTRVFVDSGNLLFKTSKASDYLIPQWYEQALGVVEAYNLLGADAVNLGENELALGIKKFQEIAKKAKFPFLSSNVYWKGKDELFLSDSLIVNRMGKKIGIFGILHPSMVLPGELEARDPMVVARSMVMKLRDKNVDMIIALTHQGYDADVEMLKTVKGIDMVVGGHSQSLLQSPDMQGNTLVVQLSSQGQMLGMAEYEVSDFPKKRSNFVVAELNNEFNEAPKAQANPMKSLVAVTRLKIEESNKILDDTIWNTHRGTGYANDSFLSCKDCHSKQSEFQAGKPHAASFLTLLAKKQDRNMDCIKCHSVGLGAPRGFKSMNEAFLAEGDKAIPYETLKAQFTIPPEGTSYIQNPNQIRPDVERWHSELKKAGVKKAFVSVQCENCHGALAGHPFVATKKVAKVSTGLCLQCHTKEQAPAWYDKTGNVNPIALEAALKSMTCPR